MTTEQAIIVIVKLVALETFVMCWKENLDKTRLSEQSRLYKFIELLTLQNKNELCPSSRLPNLRDEEK